MQHPISSGMRQPKSAICAGVSVPANTAPINEANITAGCWLPDCQAQ